VEDDRGIEAAVRQLDRTRAGVTGRSRHGGAQGGGGYRQGGGMEELAMPDCSWTEAWRTVET
jgi:hypothetical protein